MFNSRELLVCFRALVYQRDMFMHLQNKEPRTDRQAQIEQLNRTIEVVRKHIEMFLPDRKAA